MTRCAVLALGISALAGSIAAGQAGPPAAPPRSQAIAAQASSRYPIGVQLATLADHGAALAGLQVQLPPSRVARIVSPTLVVVRDAGEHGGYRFHQWREDRLLVLLPPGTTVAKGDNIALWGDVRTVRGARMSGELTGASNEVIERHGNATLLVARGVATADGVDLVARR